MLVIVRVLHDLGDVLMNFEKASVWFSLRFQIET